MVSSFKSQFSSCMYPILRVQEINSDSLAVGSQVLATVEILLDDLEFESGTGFQSYIVPVHMIPGTQRDTGVR